MFKYQNSFNTKTYRIIEKEEKKKFRASIAIKLRSSPIVDEEKNSTENLQNLSFFFFFSPDFYRFEARILLLESTKD